MKKKKNKVIKFIDWLILALFLILTIFLIINIIKLSDIENLIRIIAIIFLILLFIIITIFRKKKKLLFRIIIIILSIGYIFLNYTFYKIYSSLDNITVEVNTKVLYLVTSSKKIEDIEDITDEDIAVLSSEKDSEFYDLAEIILTNKELENKLVEYEDYIEIMNALLEDEIKYAFLPQNYEAIYNADKEEKKELDFNVLHTETKTTKSKRVKQPQSINEPFSMLLIGTDVIEDSYNADTLMLLTVNPKTLKVTMLSIPRDTYTTIAGTGSKHKINSSGWYGDERVVKTLENYLDIDINYYAKINFLGIVDLVNELDGIEVDVPYAFCEQNSQRQFGKNMIYVDAGPQTLDGEQALALSRNRHYWEGMCPSKYTTDGERSDLTRGKNQQLVIKALLNKMMTIRNINTFYGILDTVGQNMTTNMSRDTILSFYNVGKDIVKRLNKNTTDEIINIERLTFKSYSATVFISGMDLSMIVNYDESVKYISNQMKKNLGLMKEEPIKTFSFDINETYDPDEVKYKSLSSSLKTLPSFVGKTLSEAINYCNRNGIKYETTSTDLTSIITSQSISANTDISIIKSKTIIFEVKNTIEETIEKPILPSTEEKLEDEVVTEKNDNTDPKEELPSDDELPPVDILPSEDEENIEDKEDTNESEQETS